MYQATPVTKETLVNITTSAGYEILEPNSTTTERIDSILEDYKDHLEERTKHHIGYPYNLDFDFSCLHGVQNYSINNLGDPFVESNYGVHSRMFEVGVLEWFGKFWNLDISDLWGYVTNCGTEGNLHGILVGRECLPEGILYYSKESHYSVPKAARMYRMEAVEVKTLPGGDIDTEHLKECLLIGREKGKPAVLNLNVGTTVKGAVDNVDEVIRVLEETGYKPCQDMEGCKDLSNGYFIHVDGALFGLMLPFLSEMGINAPSVSFARPIGSISVSGHKFIGAPVPCGIVMTRKQHIAKLTQSIEYLNSRDSTIMGSRNGHAALFLWFALSKKGYQGLKNDVVKCIQNSKLLRDLMVENNIKCMLNDLSSTVVFERPQSHAFVRKWQLACEGELAHAVVMPSISEEKIRFFVSDLVASRDAMKETATAAAGTGEGVSQEM